MHVDSLLPRIAEHLDVRSVAPLTGGEFGALLVQDPDGRELVLKALPSPIWAARFAEGAELAGRLRTRGYPAPEYVGTGVALGASWSLQERLPGRVPDVMASAHAHRLCDLAAMHAGAAGRRQRPARVRQHAWLDTLRTSDQAATLVGDLTAVIGLGESVQLLDDGIVHSDFHHRNYLAIGDEVTGVFDWELARVGDWRGDLVTLAFWSVLLPEQIPPPVSEVIVQRARAECPAEVFAYIAACCALRQLDFDVREHPDRVAGLRDGIESCVAPWWRCIL
jgi:hypothetical protein